MQGTQEKVKNGKQRTVLCKKEKNNLKKYTEKGITLIALVVTIIILLILSGITINMLIGEGGIIKTAQEAKKTWENAIINDQENLNSLIAELDEILTDKSKDIYVYLYDDGTLAFSNASEPIEGKTIVKEYGNIKGQEYKSWTDEDNNIVSDIPWFNETSLITKVSIVDEIVPLSMASWFHSCINLTEIENIEKIDTSEVKNMAIMFYNCSSLTNLDLRSFNTSKVENMASMFGGCSNLTSLDLSSFDTSNVENMTSMFYHCTNLNNLNLSNFNTSKVKYTGWMFGNCLSLTSLDLSSFDTSNMQLMESMFASCTNLTTIYVGDNWDLTNVENTNYMFANCGTNTTTPKSSNL